jgi:uncharacterized protein (TIGR02270 family)
MPDGIEEIIDQHAEEAALCWLWRDRAVTQPHYWLSDLAHLDARLVAHLDGLQIANDLGWAKCLAECAWREPGEFFVASVLAMEAANQRLIETVIELAGDSPELLRAITSALGWLPLKMVQPIIQEFIRSSNPIRRFLAVAAASNHRFDLGESLAIALDDQDSRTRARALRSVGELGRRDLLEATHEHLQDEVQASRIAAASSIGRWLGEDGALESTVFGILREAAENSVEHSSRCLQLFVRRAPVRSADEFIENWSQSRATERIAVRAVGIRGDPTRIPWLIQQFEVPRLARLASEAFTMVTGLVISQRPFEAEWPEGFEVGPNEDANDSNVEMDEDENLPWPATRTIQAWWEAHGQTFVSGTRYLLGQPITIPWLEQVLRQGGQRQRAAAALELALRQPDQPSFEVRAPGFRQQQWLELK